jgi:hypothetical protein
MELRSAWLYEESATEACAHYAGKVRCGRWVQGRREGRPTTLQILEGGLWYGSFLIVWTCRIEMAILHVLACNAKYALHTSLPGALWIVYRTCGICRRF